jgi:protein phosphatase
MERMRLEMADPALVLLIGPSGAGKSTFARAHFKPTEIISSDALRAMLADDASNQDASAEAFRILALLVNGRLKRRLTTVVDATNLRAASRSQFRKLAARYGIPIVAVAFDLPLELFAAHNDRRPDRVVDSEVLADQTQRMVEVMADLDAEDYAALHVIRDADSLSDATVDRSGARRA